MNHTHRSLIAAACIAVLSSIATAYDTATSLAVRFVTFVLAPVAWLFKAKTVVFLDHPMHATRADDVRLASPFRAFAERARKSIAFVGDHFRTPAVCGT